MNLKPSRSWKGEILSLRLMLSLSLVVASPLWAINASTGVVTPVAGSPVATGGTPTSETASELEKRCKRDNEEVRDQRGDHDERREDRRRDDDEHRRFDSKQCGAAAAQATYLYTGTHFTNVDGVYTITDTVRGSLTVASPLAANLSGATITPSAFSFSDGIGTITNASAGLFINSFTVSTDSAGQITEWDIDVDLFSPELVFEREITTEHGPCLGFPEPPGCVFSEDAGVVSGSGSGFTDAQGTWTQATPTALLAALLREVRGVGPGKSLASKVELAQTYLAAADIQATCAVLTAFDNEVQAQAGKKIAAALDAKLLTAAQTIEAAIGCTVP